MSDDEEKVDSTNSPNEGKGNGNKPGKVDDAKKRKKATKPQAEKPIERKEETVEESDANEKDSAKKSEKSDKKRKKVRNEKRMPFLDHLEELRWCLIRSIISVVIAAIGASFFASKIMVFLMLPYRKLPEELRLAPTQFLSPAGGFMITIKVVVFAGLIIALPYVVYEIWKFVVPGLLEKERKSAPIVIITTTICFLTGAGFAFMVMLPFGLRFLLKFQTEYMVANLRIDDYLSFVTRVILAFGLVFELPVLSFILTKIGILTPKFLSSKRRYGIVIIFTVAAILTPPDPLTQIMMACPLLALYELSILVSRIVAKKEAKTNEQKHEETEEEN